MRKAKFQNGENLVGHQSTKKNWASPSNTANVWRTTLVFYQWIIWCLWRCFFSLHHQDTHQQVMERGDRGLIHHCIIRLRIPTSRRNDLKQKRKEQDDATDNNSNYNRRQLITIDEPNVVLSPNIRLSPVDRLLRHQYFSPSYASYSSAQFTWCDPPNLCIYDLMALI